MKRKERKKQDKNMSIRSRQLEARGVSMDMKTSWAAQDLTYTYSDLNNMARFQQKQLQEKEQKLLQLYDQQQQRAYQVVQRGSAGSTGSNHATSISQHTVTKTSSSSHTTSTSQGGKVRQMFDERRQTTMKGIDRSYPLEPLENKPRKQANGNGVQKNGNLTVNRQSVTVKRVARADVNSNLNGGKPVVSYHEEITRESFGPSARQQEDDEFGNENHVARYANGNHRDETRIEEVLDDDMIERNRMMAKLHLMEYDETLKHRVKNDLESEEFPEDFMVDVPDKLPKQSVTKKLSQAEARLERFKNANAKRGNSVTKNTTIASKKRSDPIFPAKSTSSQDRVAKTRTREVSDRRARKGDKSPASSRPGAETVASETPKEATEDSERNASRTDDGPRFFCGESEKFATAYAIDSKTRTKLSNESLKGRTRPSESPKFPRGKSGKSGATHAVDPKTAGKFSPRSARDETGRSDSPKFFCKESEKSATTYAVDSRTARKFSSEVLKDSSTSLHRESGKSTFGTIDSKTVKRSTREISNDTKDVGRRSESPKFFCDELGKLGIAEVSKTVTDVERRSESPYGADLKTAQRIIREDSKGPKDLKWRSESPKYGTDSKTGQRLTREDSKGSKDLKWRSESPKYGTDLQRITREDSKGPKDLKRRSESPKYGTDSQRITREDSKGLKDLKSRSESPKYATDSKTAQRLTREDSKGPKDLKRRSESPRYGADSKTAQRLTREDSKGPKDLKRRSESPRYGADSKTAQRLTRENSKGPKDLKRRSESPRYGADSKTAQRLTREDSKGPKDLKRRSESPKYGADSKTAQRIIREDSKGPKDLKRRSESPKYATDSQRITREDLKGPKDFKRRSESPKFGTDSKTAQRLTREDSKGPKDLKRRSESPRFGADSKTAQRITREDSKGPKGLKSRSESPKYATDSQRITREDSKGPKDFKRRSESPKYATDSQGIIREDSKGPKDLKSRSEDPKYTTDLKTTQSLTREDSKGPKDFKRRSESPKYATDLKTTQSLTREDSKGPKDFKLRSESPKYATDLKTTQSLTRKDSKGPKDFKHRSESPKYATDSKTTQSLTREDSKGPKDFKHRSGSPKFFCKESEKSATTYAIDSETAKKFSDFSKAPRPHTTSPEFLYDESEKSSTTYAMDSRSYSTSPDYMRNTTSSILKIEPKNRKNIIDHALKDSVNDTVDRHIEKSSSPEYDTVSYSKPGTQRDSKSTMNDSPNVFQRLTRGRSSSPGFFCREGKKSATTMSFDDRDTSKSPSFTEKSIKKRSQSPKIPTQKHRAKSGSPDFGKFFRKSNTSPQFFPSYSADRSATIMMVTPETIAKSKTESTEPKRRKSPCFSKPEKPNSMTDPRKTPSTESNDASSRNFIRNSVSRFFSEQCERAERNVDWRNHVRSAKIVRKRHPSRGSSPLALKDTRTPSPTDSSRFYHERDIRTDRSSIDRASNRESSSKSTQMINNREGTPEFFRYESETSRSKDFAKEASKSPSSMTRKASPKCKSPTKDLETRLSKSPDSESSAKNRRGSGNVLRSTRLIRDAMRRQNDSNQVDYAWERRAKGSPTISTGSTDTDGISEEWKLDQRSRDEANRKVDGRAGSPAAGELPVAESSGKSWRCAEVDTEIREITMADRYIKQEQSRGTYSRPGNKTSAGGEKSSIEKLFTYSVRGPVKQRGSLFESNVFERSLGDRTDGEACDSGEEERISSRHGARDSSSRLCSGKAAVVRGSKRRAEDAVGEKGGENISRCRGETGPRKTSLGKSDKERHDISKLTPSTVDQSTIRASKPRKTDTTSTRNATAKISKPRDLATSPRPKGSFSDETKKRGTPSPRTDIPKSMELVRRAMRVSDSENARTACKMVQGVTPDVVREEQIEITRSSSTSSTMIEVRESGSGEVSIKEGTSSGKNYERTDSVESALRRFDSIGTEAGSESMQGSLGRSEESITWKRQTESGKTEGSGDDTKTISLKALDRPNVNLSRGHESKPRTSRTSRTSSRKASTVQRESPGKGRVVGRLTRCEKKFAKARNSIEIARIVARSKSPGCKRMLFRDADSGEECSLDTETERRTMSDGNESGDQANNACRSFECRIDDETSIDAIDKGERKETSTGADRSLSVKQLRSIEDIRKSIVGESWDRKATGTSRKSVMACNARRGSSAAEVTEAASARSEPRRINIDDRAGNRKEISLPRRSGHVDARKDALGNTSRSSVKCTMRFSRVAKSPSPETTKATETSSRARRNVPASPSKSPDTVARRPSTELKAQDTKSTKRPTPMKGAEPIGNRKTTTTMTTTTTAATTSTSTRKSTDVVDGAILENGLHLRDQTAETKYDNDSPTTKKSDAFVIDFDEQPPKENDAPLPRKPLFRKQSTEKQIPSTQSVRPPSSVSSTSSGSSVQGQVSGSRGKMASRAKTPISGSTSYKGSAGSKSGGGAAAVESLVACKVCGRRFAQDRVSLHEQICAKTGQKKRKQFDAMMYRVRGTDIEPFFKKGLVKKQLEKSKKPEVKSNWRRKHEDFINAIRSAKQVQAHLAAGGKLSDLPPPPVSDNCDYIQCPHCGRKFNKAAAERHIPKCEHMLHNKPIHSRAPKPRR